ncbi:malectin domain-containing carbohydrate-binding protein [Dyadobacter sp. NIV53]|uniref:malectin domain-containing carbohydrate-binding protein n=1 Tax=Dyadobacter sp. NIV53 TaxID=2861765 RepID=UPI001C87B7BE|nr:malectin domain-containing carbohydrate-binding protein [Dyadobacter sp. NIV53]
MVKIYSPHPNSTKLNFKKLTLLLTLCCSFYMFPGAASAASEMKESSALIFTKPALADGAYMVLQNMDNFPANDQLTFSLIQIPWRRTSPDTTAFNENHDQVKLRIYSKGSENLVVSGLTLSNSAAWKIVSVGGEASPSYPISIAPRGFSEVIIQFIAQDAAPRVKVFHDNLMIASNDATVPNKEVKLTGLFQYKGESNNEPYIPEIIDAFNFKTNPGFVHTDGASDGDSIKANSDEVAAAYFIRADASKAINVYQLAAYHGCCANTETFRYYPKSDNTSLTALFTHTRLDGQSLLPRKNTPLTSLAQGTFSPSFVFGIKAGSFFSDRTLNPDGKISLRFEKVRDSNGNIVPNAYLMGMDYLDNSSTNYDYQDNVYYIDNIRPETGSPHYSNLAATSGSDVNFDATSSESIKATGVTVQNQGTTYPDGSSDPAIEITEVRITGPNASEFSVAPLATTLAIQSSISIDVTFNPTSAGIKNAALLVFYKSGSSPLRIPLYGQGTSNASIVEAVKRIKGGSNTGLTLNGITYEADQAYRTGSIKLDAQVTPSGIEGTDIDALYQTYLSAATDLAQTGYNIPLTNGNYMIRMHLVENFFPSQGSRVFSATMENQQIITSLDIFKEVGYRTAVVKDFNTTVSDGTLNINFVPSVNRVAIAALEIFRLAENPLPVTLIDFTAKKEGQTALLNWSTASETNSKLFEVQRSVNGTNWNVLGEVAAQGESATDFHYSFPDTKPLNGENLYRLKMVDHDESFAYSRIVNLSFENILSSSEETIYPNPVADILTLKVDDWSKVGQVQLYSLTGKLVYQSQQPIADIDVKQLPAGLYVVHIKRTDGSLLTYKVVKN